MFKHWSIPKPPRRGRVVNALLAAMLVGCSSASIETLGCGCAGMTVTSAELTDWYDRATRDDVEAINHLRAYAMFKAMDADGSSRAKWHRRELALEQRLVQLGEPNWMWRVGEHKFFVARNMPDNEPLKRSRYEQGIAEMRGAISRRAELISMGTPAEPYFRATMSSNGVESLEPDQPERLAEFESEYAAYLARISNRYSPNCNYRPFICESVWVRLEYPS